MTPEERVLENNRLIRERRMMALEQARIEAALQVGSCPTSVAEDIKQESNVDDERDPWFVKRNAPPASKRNVVGDLDVMNHFMPFIISSF